MKLLGARRWLLLTAVLLSVRATVLLASRSGYPANRLPSRNPFLYNSYSNYGDGRNYANDAKAPSQSSPEFETDDRAIGGEQCTVAQLNSHFLPTASISQLKFLMHAIPTADSRESCAELCCELGPDICQYAWYFREMCVAIACGVGEERLCVPYRSEGPQAESYYMEMAFGADAVSISDPSTEPPTTSGSSETTPTTVETTPTTLPTTEAAPVTVSVATTAATPPATKSPEGPSLVAPLQVAVSGDLILTLPRNRTTVFANTWPEPRFHEQFSYQWEKLAGPGPGQWSGETGSTLGLYELVEGTYQLKLTVTDLLSEHSPGEAFINVTVLPAARVNSPPVPVIKPSDTINVFLPQNSAILDASSSEDDLGAKGLSFRWEEVSGRVDSPHPPSLDTPVLELTDLKPGHYQYRLTVVDGDGAQTTASAEVIVHEERDYPPVASADNSRIIRLPFNEVYLYGNQSTDDKGNLQYQWQMVSGPGAVDLEGTATPVLHALHLSQGVYQFRLTVTDSAGQSSSVDVTVDVMSEENTPPVAVAGDNQTIVFPKTTVTLDGRGSSDDYRITSFHWSQLSGPMDVSLSGVDTPVLEVSELHIDETVGSPTVYQFKLSVVDYRNTTNSTTVFVEFHKDPKVPPRADAGPNLTLTLPQDTVLVNGSASADDFGIDFYQWSKSSDSPAAGDVIGSSDKTPVLVLSNLVAGSYHFTLTVTNKNKQKDSDTMSLTVQANTMDPHVIQIYLEGAISNFTEADKVQFGKALALMLEDTGISIMFQGVRASGPLIMVEFYALTSGGQPVNATEGYLKLTTEGQDYHFTRFHIVRVDMKVCRLPCSGHGSCDLETKRCVCQSFWMENPFKLHFGKRQTNCDWSVFYVALVAVLSFALLVFVGWLCCCCCLKRRRIARTKRRVRYAILDHKDNEEAMEMLPKDSRSYQQSSLMVSESETEEEILFENSKKMGSTNTNGSIPSPKSNNSKVKNNNIIPK